MSRRRRQLPRRQSPRIPAFRRWQQVITPAEPGDPQTRVRVGDPADLLALVPYLLGFHPQQSVVAVLIRSGQVMLTARIDLPPAARLGALAHELRRLATQHRAAELVLISYSTADADGRSQLSVLVDGLRDLDVSDAILVDGDRWWSLLCTGACCPPQGRPYEVESHPLAAEAVYAGMTVRGGRAELAELVAGPREADLERLGRLADAAARQVSELGRQRSEQRLEATLRSAVAGAELDEPRRLQLALLVTDVLLRDQAWAKISRSEARAHLQLWASVVAVTPPELASAPLCLLGLAAWISGDGALQNCCVERLERIHPDYSLGILLGDISARALSPAVWDELQADIQAELGSLAG